MSTRIAINGLGRIGRSILKLVTDEPAFELVAVNDLVEVENLAYLLRLDTVYGRYAKPVAVDAGDLVIADRRIRTVHRAGTTTNGATRTRWSARRARSRAIGRRVDEALRE